MNEACGLRFEIHVFLINVPHSVCAPFLSLQCFAGGVPMDFSATQPCIWIQYLTLLHIFACISVSCMSSLVPYLIITADIPK